MGPNTDNYEIMKGLALNNMDVARFNFSHGSYAEHKGGPQRSRASNRSPSGHQRTGDSYRIIKRTSESNAGSRTDLYAYNP